ncbi:alginate lyase family protein [Aquimarina algiphila]|uniref:Heparinase n=1 Tax=Aquimarina algiphila TaxID=2047982 RepID=A0A554VBY9_9FLAO|nr:alginate lyase family protein [Aquimarina algiphila]TSE04144.1 heparinase [Aquimarina algiphila]
MVIIIRNILIVLVFIFFPDNTLAQKNWKEIISIKDLNDNYPEILHHIFDHINLNYPGLEKVKDSYDNNEVIKACEYLLLYYKNGNTSNYLRKKLPIQTHKTIAQADTILKNVFTIQNVKGKVPYGKDGHRDWYYKGPNEDAEWAWLSNRHHQVDEVLNAYFDTGNPKYVIYIDSFLRDFIIKSQPYPNKQTWGAIWRGLEVSFRNKSWPRIFYSLIDSEHLLDVTKLLILSSLSDHADYNHKYHIGGNWLTMELSGLSVVATCFPEYKKSEEWLSYATEKLTQSIADQVYDDGVQNELTSHYHYVALMNFEEFKNTCELAGKKVPSSLIRTIEKMYDYTAKSIRPSGFGGLNNDGDLMYNRDNVLKGAKKFDRPDWEYIASNGKTGLAPFTLSYFFPWAGQLISRNGFDKDAHWSFFDVGPWGATHQHNDKLHISVSAYGRDLLVDSGRFAYKGEVAKKFRSYAQSSAGHNTVLIDHKGQGEGPSVTEKPLDTASYKITDEFDYATGSFNVFNDIQGKAIHNRSIFYIRGDFWIVVDKIITDRPREIQTLWHWHPECIVEQENKIVKTNHEKGNLAIIPVGYQDFKITQIKGREKPSPQGWYSSMYNQFEPNTATSYSTTIKANKTLVWILQPSKNKLQLLKPKIIAEDNSQIKIEVKSKQYQYQVNIPFYNSTKAALIKK